MSRLLRDLLHAWRSALRKPAFTAAAAGTLALGVGTAVATFSVVDAVLLRSLPFRQPDALVALWSTRPERGTDRLNVSPRDFRAWREASTMLSGLAAFTVRSRVLTGVDDPGRLRTVPVTRDFFETLGLEPVHGRRFRPEEFEAGGEGVAILGGGLWRRRFGGDPEVVGREVRLDGRPYTVVGILDRPRFDLMALRGRPSAESEVDVWTPLAFDAPGAGNPIGHWLTAFARLGEGVPLERARAEMETIAARLARERPDTNTDWSVRLEPLREAVVGSTRPILALLSGAVALVLLIAGTNVANLLLMRGTDRKGELAVRASLGAGRRRLVRQLLTETGILALLAWGAGIGLAVLAVDLLRAFGLAAFLPRGDVALDGRAVGFALGLSLLVGLVAGLIPSLRASGSDLSAALRTGGSRGSTDRGGRAGSRTLAVVQVALSVALLAGAGLLTRSLWRLQSVDPGFRPADVVAFDLSLPGFRYDDRASVERFFAQVQGSVSGVPEVSAVGAITRLPLDSEGWCGTFVPLGGEPVDPEDAPCAEYRSVRGDYFGTMGIPIRAGRDLEEADDGDAPRVVVVNRTMARRFFPSGEAVGRRVVWEDTFRIVGVVEDVRQFELGRAPAPQFYVSHAQDPNGSEVRDLTVVVRAEAGLEALATPLRRAVHALDPEIPVHDLRRMRDVLSRNVAAPRIRAAVLAGFALTALLLSALGTYAVVGYQAARRERELGIRIALGARRRDVVRLLLRRGLLMTGVGVALGSLLALPAGRLLSGFLYGVSPGDPVTLVAILGILLLAGGLASWLPARRAGRVDPMAVLRPE